tara:strand:- start:108511 stop:111528 length:3018 start_codon:yes stop_codon:yes gene_type:complete
MSFVDPIIDAFDSLLEWLSNSLHQTTRSYCELETVLDKYTLVGRDGSLVSIVKIDGIQFLVGDDEFKSILESLSVSLQPTMKQPGQTIQVLYSYDTTTVKQELKSILEPSWNTAQDLSLDLNDLFEEKINYLSHYCSNENVYLVLWTNSKQLNKQQRKQAGKRKMKEIKDHKIPPMQHAQAIFCPTLELKESHHSFVRTFVSDLKDLNIMTTSLDVHHALRAIRMSVDPEITNNDWRPYLPGDPIPVRDEIIKSKNSKDVSELMWPTIARQIIPRDGEIVDLRTARIGNKLYAPLYIDLFPQQVQPFTKLLQRALNARIPWRISFLVDSEGLDSLNIASTVAAILSFASSFNPLINDAKKYLSYIATNTDDAVVKLRVSIATWADITKPNLLRQRAAELHKVVQGWGGCEVREISGDAFAGVISSALGVTTNSIATPSVAPLSDVLRMLPIMRPASPWEKGAILFRSIDGKPMPYQPGSSLQTTWIDIVYARPGSGKSVLSNAINLALCLSPGLKNLPIISIIDIGPSSSGLISLIQESLPKGERHYAAYHRLRMTNDYAINPFDTQLGARYPTPQERSFLVNFLILLATPVGSAKTYDGVSDMAGLIVDEVYKGLSDEYNPNKYTQGIDEEIDTVLANCKFQSSNDITWWQVTDFLFEQHEVHHAKLAQRYAVPVLSDVSSSCRASAISDLFGKIIVSTGENLIDAFGRMISSSVREYPVLAQITKFDLGDAKIVSLDLDEVAKTGGEAADRQTAVMYMLARYILAKDFYMNIENLSGFPEKYKDYHKTRIIENKEVPKRIVFDEFHRTSKVKAVRDQVVVDMREGRKWNVQVALLSQSLDDFDSVMIEFATSIFIMDSGPIQAVEKTASIFGLTPTQKKALRTQVHGPREGGGTFLAQFATKKGIYTQLLTNTIGPIELWAFSTTSTDVRVRDELYDRIGPKMARAILAHMFPGGSVAPLVEQRLLALRKSGGVSSDSSQSILKGLIEEIVKEFNTNPLFRKH